MLLEAKAIKGAELSPKEIAKFEKLFAEIAMVDREIEELQAKEHETETHRQKALAEVVIQTEIEKARMEPKSEERARVILSEIAAVKKRMRELGYRVNKEGVDSPDSSEIVLPYYIWIHSWLQANEDTPNIETSLDCYIEQYSLLLPSQDETKELTERRIKCELLKEALQHIESFHWETLNDHLRKSQQILMLLEEQAARWAHIAKSFAETQSSVNETSKIVDDPDFTELTYEKRVELVTINSEIQEIGQRLQAGAIDPKVAIARLDQLEDRLAQMEHGYSQKWGSIRKFFRDLFKHTES